MKTRSELRALQESMARYLVTGDTRMERFLATRPGLAGQRRLAIYAHAYRARLTEALREGHGHTASYLGTDAFELAAEGYIADHPSVHSNLRWFGARFPEWLARRHPARAELGELARLDAALRRAFDGENAAALAPARLRAMEPHEIETLRLQFVPTFERLVLDHNTLAIWHALDRNEAVPAVQRLEAPVEIAVWRVDWRPHFRSVGAVESAAISSLGQGIRLQALCEAVQERYPERDSAAEVGALLKRWLDESMLRAPGARAAFQIRRRARDSRRGGTRGP